MNNEIRSWIENYAQPWRNDDKGFINPEVVSYFQNRGYNIANKSHFELLDEELIKLFKLVSSWPGLKENDVVQNFTAIGYTQTYEANSMAFPCINGFGILFDSSFDELLIASFEIWFGYLLNPKYITTEQFPIVFNNAITSIFFGLTEHNPPFNRINYPHRPGVNSHVWMVTVFVLLHELGHIVEDHFYERLWAQPENFGTYNPYNPGRPDFKNRGHFRKSFANFLNPEINALRIDLEQELSADGFAFRHLLNAFPFLPQYDDPGMSQGVIMLAIGWFFSVQSAVEIFAERLELNLPDTHPPAQSRWDRLKFNFQSFHQNIPYNLYVLDGQMRELALNAAINGPLPKLDEKQLEVLYRLKNQFILMNHE